MSKRVFLFSESKPESEVLGGKGANLARMSQLGLNVPVGFTITTQTCIDFLHNEEKYPVGLWERVLQSLEQIEKISGKKFGNESNPLLVSVRSGAKVSMPGMMDTVLNVGLTKDNVENLSKSSNNGRFVKDSYRRLIMMFSNVVHNLPIHEFEDALENAKKDANVTQDNELNEEQLDKLIEKYLELYAKDFGKPFPQEPKKQLDMAIQAVFKSWNNKRAIDYRTHENIPHDIGTAVNVQSMVFGNLNDNSGTGVLFTRNPASGVNEIFGEYLLNAQGEDVVAGIRTPQPFDKLKDEIESAHTDLVKLSKDLETHYKDMQDIEFTIEDGQLFILQTRTGKRTGAAAAKIAVDMVEEGLITKEEAVLRITPRDVEASLFPSILWKFQNTHEYYDVPDVEHKLKSMTLPQITKDAATKQAEIIGEGLPAGPGAACGHVVFDSDLAEAIVKDGVNPPFEVTQWRMQGEKKVPNLILVKKETSPEDFHGMVASSAIVTMTGGLTSHAALVGRQIGKRVIVGASSSKMDLTGKNIRLKDGSLIETGDVISVDVFDKGMIYKGCLPILNPIDLSPELQQVLDWADDFAKIKVRTNADKGGDTQIALDFKAVGTGLARTEHMFFDSLELMQQMILAETEEDRLKALDKMAEIQKHDFIELFKVAGDRPVTIRLLDPPLHEFLPKELEIRERIWVQILNPVSTDVNTNILRKVLFYQESNPMLGLRGCRLGLLFPEITIMQTRAIIEAALE
ncbi:MAG: Pyruvate, phosphate dikinase, partial [Candidatus Heimdallarchaeota archaeon LC_2]